MIAVAFLILGGLLAWFVIGSRGRWPLKLAAIIVVSVFTLAIWLARASGDGYPTRGLPARALFVAGIVREPDPRTGDPGRIYLWLVPPRHGRNPFAYQPGIDEPRAYVEPYSRGLQAAVERAMQGARAGQRMELRRTHAQRRGQHTRGRFIAYKLPPATAPKKEGH